MAQLCENLEHVLLQVTTRPGFEEAHAQAIFKKYLDLRDWTAEQLVRRAEYAEFQHWSCWPHTCGLAERVQTALPWRKSQTVRLLTCGVFDHVHSKDTTAESVM